MRLDGTKSKRTADRPCPRRSGRLSLPGKGKSGLSPKSSFELNDLLMEATEHTRPSASRGASRVRAPRIYRLCDGLTEAVVYFEIVFGPWAFGATERWSIWTLNFAGYALGAMLLTKWWVRRLTGYLPARWGVKAAVGNQRSE